MLTRGLSFRHDLSACFTLYVLLSLHNVINNARLLVVEINPTVLLGNFLVRADQLLISKGAPNGICSHFLPPEVISEPVNHMCL